MECILGMLISRYPFLGQGDFGLLSTVAVLPGELEFGLVTKFILV